MRPNVIGNPYGAGGPNAYLNKAAFAIPLPSAPFGNLGRNSLRAPNFWQWDLGLSKNFAIPGREGMALQFRSEFFNLLNHTNFGMPDANISDAAFGTIRSTYPARQIGSYALALSERARMPLRCATARASGASG